MKINPGVRLKSAVCDAQVVVVRGMGDVELTCGGVPMVNVDSTVEADARPTAGHDGGSLLGKRYADAGGTVEVLCVSPGDGSLALAGTPLEMKAAKALPASD